VVAHVRADTLRDETNPQVYLPYHHDALGGLSVVMKVLGDPILLSNSARTAFESLGGRRPVYDVRAMSAYVTDAMAESRFLLVLLALFAGLALILSAIGLYGVVAYTTAQRTREIGIRTAFGATRSDVLKLVVGDGLRWTAAGLLLGLAGAAAMTRYLETMLFGVVATDVLTFVSTAILLTIVAAAACYLPARRATQIEALHALGAE
jgi:putative ABC transport system permease protein